MARTVTNDNIINGSDLMLFIDGKSVGFATNHTLNISAEFLENASKDHNYGKWKGRILKSLDWTGSTENLFANAAEGYTYDTLEQKLVAGTPVEVILSVNKKDANVVADASGLVVPEGGWDPDDTSGNIYYKGMAVIQSANVTAQNGEIATFTVEFAGTGPFEKFTVQ